jgi:shikimate 5-dehydrogenase
MMVGLMAVLALAWAGAIALADQERTCNADVREMGAGQQLGEANDTWKDRIANYRLDMHTLTNRLAAFNSRRIAATNAIAGATGANRAALYRLQDEVDDLWLSVTALQHLLQDLQRATQAGLAGRRK